VAAGERALLGVRAQVIVEVVELAKDSLAPLDVTLEKLLKPVRRGVPVLKDAEAPRARSRGRAALLRLKSEGENLL
jgi:hypothetical protein